MTDQMVVDDSKSDGEYRQILDAVRYENAQLRAEVERLRTVEIVSLEQEVVAHVETIERLKAALAEMMEMSSKADEPRAYSVYADDPLYISLVKERDELRAEVERLKTDDAVTYRSRALLAEDAIADLRAEVEMWAAYAGDLKAEVERLRAQMAEYLEHYKTWDKVVAERDANLKDYLIAANERDSLQAENGALKDALRSERSLAADRERTLLAEVERWKASTNSERERGDRAVARAVKAEAEVDRLKREVDYWMNLDAGALEREVERLRAILELDENTSPDYGHKL